MNLTQKAANSIALPKGQSELLVFDDALPGFGIRLRAGGAARWIYQFKVGVQHRRVTLGSASALSAAQARKTASELHAKVRLGVDPAGEKAESRARAGETMEAVLRPYLAHKRTTMRLSSYTGIERHLLKHCRQLHGLQISKIDRRAVAATLAAVAAKSGPIEANRVRASLSAFASWCIAEGLLDHNFVAGTNRHPERSRDRVLTDSDLKAIWKATAGDDDYSAVVRLLMLTAARADEIASLRWTEIDFDGGRIVLPASRVKNAREHQIPLSEPARAILAARPRRDGRDLVFGRRHDLPLSGWSVLKGALDARIKDSGAVVAHWTHHDLRRSVVTIMCDRLGIAPHVAEAVLGHVSGHKHGVAGIYNRASYEREKRTALDRWAEHLMSVVEGRASKVVPLHGAIG